ncbi:hypothetical protein L208DRAFT_1399714 [Tricholoma matsutake]|nr:hypothetical protein L208DRAFT_1399714 [Tricholoma matsutake 945]
MSHSRGAVIPAHEKDCIVGKAQVCHLPDQGASTRNSFHNIFILHRWTKLPPQRPSTPWNIVHVCSKWRGVALQVPNLWNDISVSFSSDRQLEFTRLTIMLDVFLSRTGNALISLEILAEHIQSSPLGSPDPFCKSIEAIVRPYAGRLRHLSIRPPDQFAALLGQTEHALDVLESVSLYVPHFPDDVDAATAGLTIPGGSHNLHKITVSTDSTTIRLKSLLFPWAQLTELRILNTIVTYAGCHAALRQCHNLVSFSLGYVPGDRVCHGNIPNTLLRNLKSLSIVGCAEGRYGHFLRPFVLPSLKEFLITGGTDADWLGLPSLITRSKCSLERFEAQEFLTYEMLEFLHQVPSLIELSLRSSGQNIPELLSLGLVPNLQIFECDMDCARLYIDPLEYRSRHLAVKAMRSWIIYGDPEKAHEIIKKSARILAHRTNIIFQATEV